MEDFIDGLINGQGGQEGSYDKLPDIVQVHNYADESPEFTIAGCQIHDVVCQPLNPTRSSCPPTFAPSCFN